MRMTDDKIFGVTGDQTGSSWSAGGETLPPRVVLLHHHDKSITAYAGA